MGTYGKMSQIFAEFWDNYTDISWRLWEILFQIRPNSDTFPLVCWCKMESSCRQTPHLLPTKHRIDTTRSTCADLTIRRENWEAAFLASNGGNSANHISMMIEYDRCIWRNITFILIEAVVLIPQIPSHETALNGPTKPCFVEGLIY